MPRPGPGQTWQHSHRIIAITKSVGDRRGQGATGGTIALILGNAVSWPGLTLPLLAAGACPRRADLWT